MVHLNSSDGVNWKGPVLEKILLVRVEMSTSKKLILLCLTIWPLIYLAYTLFTACFLSFVDLIQIPPVLIVIHLITITILLGLIIYYSIHLYRNEQVDDESKLMWFVGILFAGAFVMIFYWRKYIW